MNKNYSNNISIDSADQGMYYTVLSCITEMKEYSSVYFFVVARKRKG